MLDFSRKAWYDPIVDPFPVTDPVSAFEQLLLPASLFIGRHFSFLKIFFTRTIHSFWSVFLLFDQLVLSAHPIAAILTAVNDICIDSVHSFCSVRAIISSVFFFGLFDRTRVRLNLLSKRISCFARITASGPAWSFHESSIWLHI